LVHREENRSRGASPDVGHAAAHKCPITRDSSCDALSIVLYEKWMQLAAASW